MYLRVKVLIYIVKYSILTLKHLKTFEYFEVRMGKKGIKHYDTTGIVLYYNNHILLVRAEKHGENKWSYPKGKIDKGENILDAAVRELEEETGVKIPKKLFKNIEPKQTKPNWKKKGVKHYWYFEYELSSEEFNKYFDGEYKINKSNLPKGEIAKAMFVPLEDVESKLDVKFHSILK